MTQEVNIKLDLQLLHSQEDIMIPPKNAAVQSQQHQYEDSLLSK